MFKCYAMSCGSYAQDKKSVEKEDIVAGVESLMKTQSIFIVPPGILCPCTNVVCCKLSLAREQFRRPQHLISLVATIWEHPPQSSDPCGN